MSYFIHYFKHLQSQLVLAQIISNFEYEIQWIGEWVDIFTNKPERELKRQSKLVS